MAGYRAGLTLTLPEFDTNDTLKRFASEHTAESKVAYLWLRRRAQNALIWQVLSALPVEVLDVGMVLRVGAKNGANATAGGEGNKGMTLKDLANMPQEQQMAAYLDICKQAGIDTDKLKEKMDKQKK